MKKLLFVTVLMLLLYNSVPAQTERPTEVGIDEKLGQTIPLDLTFFLENGDSIALQQLIDKPTILSFVYYRCPGICPRQLGGMAEMLRRLSLDPTRDYQVITISFDPADTPADSRDKKNNYLHAIGKPYPEEAWRFLTGKAEPIARITDAVGYRYLQEEDYFLHPSGLIILTPDGKIVRYLYGLSFLPLDVQLALGEASEGKVGATIAKVMQYCYRYDPEGRKYAFNITKVMGTIILFLVAVFIGALIVAGRIRKK